MSYIKENDFLKSYKSYLLDTKPYHTKLDRIFAEYLFQDNFKVSLLENKPYMQVYLQNVFDASSLGGWRLYHTIESSVNSRKFKIPQTIIPRFSLNSYNEQFPVGHDPATEDDFPNIINEVPWAPPGTQLTRQGWSYSHQEGVTDELPYVADIAKVEIEITSISAISGGDVTFTYIRHIYYDTSNIFGADLSAVNVYKDGIPLITVAPDPYYVFDTLNERISIIGLTKTFHVEIDFDMLLLTEEVNGQQLITDMTYTALAPSIIDGGNVDIEQTITAITPHVKMNLYNDNQGIYFNFSDSGTYKVPFHNGSYVTVDDVEQIFGEDYIVSRSRDAIQFLDGKHPTQDADIRINYFNVDRMFIALIRPFDVNVANGLDDRSYDNFLFDNYLTSGETFNSDYFELTVDSSLPGGYKVEFFNAIENTVKGSIQDVVISEDANDGEVWTITAIAPKVLKVTGSITGESGKAFYRKRYDNGKIAFTIKNTFLSYYMVPDNPQPPLPSPPVGDTATYSDFDFSLFNIFTFAGSRDTQDYLINLNLSSTHGIADDFNSQPISYFDDPVDITPFGRITVDKDRQYYFELTDTPALGSILEFRVEQNTQYNTWVQVELKESLIINDINLLSDYLDLINNGFDLPDFDSQGMDIEVVRDVDGTLHNEPFQIATAGIQESLVFDIDYVDATPDSIIVEDILYNVKYSQSTAINELYLHRFPYVDGSPGTGPEIFRVVNYAFTPSAGANGTLAGLSLGQDPDITFEETWTITGIDDIDFTVVGSISGAMADAAVGIPYDNGKISFTLTNGTENFNVAGGDTFTFDVSGGFVTTQLNSGDPTINVIVPDVTFLHKAVNVSPAVVGTGDGVIQLTDIDQTTAVPETWTITATSATNFTVTGSVSGAAPAATVGTQYNDIISFKITAGGTPFIAGDEFTIVIKRDWSMIHVKFNVARTFDLYLV